MAKVELTERAKFLGLSVECPICLSEESSSRVCGYCVGWGFVKQEDADCIHEFVATRKLGNCYYELKCVKCGKITEVDSSD